MTWLILLIIVLALFLILGFRRIAIPREPDREAIADSEAVRAYDQMSRGLLFAVARYVVINRLKQYHPKGTLADVGCGPGYLAALVSRRYRQLRVIGLDIDGEMVRIARQSLASNDTNGTLDFLVGDVQRLPFKDRSIDFVLSTASLHHWLDAREALREVYRVLKPGGRFLFADLRRDTPRLFYYAFRIGQAVLTPTAIRRTNGAVGSLWASYTPAEVKALLSETPWRNARLEPRAGWMFIFGDKT